ncbi:uncharacterized protein LOC111706611 [Eurytemora carolleeae]|uniref:uncharacterized protein LOC111706611 n=1 Tax=Eurytemora carolleeae TaxID=1294199 RepID=UPI000C76A6C1|nr:uncharacterized protein LOC111706611 [Eurytemora carolleeae]|eukprot:XP_023335294.1 uncharacterized protein LOC111706611 [Eurytemora affinis]
MQQFTLIGVCCLTVVTAWYPINPASPKTSIVEDPNTSESDDLETPDYEPLLSRDLDIPLPEDPETTDIEVPQVPEAPMNRELETLSVGPGGGPTKSIDGITYSFVAFDELYNLTREQHDTLAYNYTQMQFTPNEPIKLRVPTTLAFDIRSPLKKYYPPNLNPPMEYNFSDFPQEDHLTHIYRKELEISKVDVDPHLVDQNNLKFMLNNVFTLPRNEETNSTLKDSIGQYILRKLGNLGLLSGTQVFTPSQFHNWFWAGKKDWEIPAGSNIIAVYPGVHYATKLDKIVVVGAHWDTVASTDGYNDNGSGVAAVLEAARAISESKCKLKYSIFFVAFDKEENGSQGSHEFLRGFLINHFNVSHWPEFQGAIIMDSIINFNGTKNSQIIPTDWRNEVPSTLEQVASNEFRGDFLSIFYRKEPEGLLANLVKQHNQKLNEDPLFVNNIVNKPDRYKYMEFPVNLPTEPPPIKYMAKYAQFLRSDHARFWYSKEHMYTLSLRAVLLTDTGPYRGLMQQCYHQQCDSKRGKFKGVFADFNFLSKTVQTVIDTITDMAGAECPASIRSQTMKRFAKSSETSWEELNIGDEERKGEVGGKELEEEKEMIEEKEEKEEKEEEKGEEKTVPKDPFSKTKDSLMSVTDLLENGVSDELNKDDIYSSPSSIKSSASRFGPLANTALYIAYSFRWVPSLFVMG